MRRALLRAAQRVASVDAGSPSLCAHSGACRGTGAARRISLLAESSDRPAFSRSDRDAAVRSAFAPMASGPRSYSSEAEPTRETSAADSTAPDLRKQIRDLMKDEKFEDAAAVYKLWRASPEWKESDMDAKFFNALLEFEGKRRGDANIMLRRFLHLLKDMRAAGVRPDPSAFEPLCAAAFDKNSFEVAEAVLSGMKSLGISGSDLMSAYAVAISCASAEYQRRTQIAFRLLKEAIEAGAVPGPSSDSRVRVRARTGAATLLTSLCRQNRPDEAVVCAKILQDINFPPGQASYGELLASAAEMGDVPSMTFALKSLNEYVLQRGEGGVAIDQGTAVRCLNSATPGAARLAEDVWAFLRACRARRSVQPAPEVFEAIIAARSAHGDIRGAFEALVEWAAAHPLDGSAPGGWGALSSLRPLVRAIVASKDLDGAYYMLVDMQAKDATVPAAAVTAVVAACARAGDMQRAFATFEELGRTFPARPNTATFNALLEGCISRGRADAVPSLAAEMEVQGVAGDCDTLGHLVDAARMRGDVDGAIALARSRQFSESEPPPRGAIVRLHQYAGKDPALREKARRRIHALFTRMLAGERLNAPSRNLLLVDVLVTDLGLAITRGGSTISSLTH